MASTTILSDNGVSSGSAGIKTTGGNDGALVLQTTTAGGAATTTLTLGSDQSVTAAGNLKTSSGYMLGTTGTSGFLLLGTASDTTSGGTIVVRNNSSTYDAGGAEFYTGGAERMRIDSSGNLLVGTTSTSQSSGTGLKFITSDTTNPYTAQVCTSSTSGYTTHHLYSTGAGAYRFYVNGAGTVFATSTTISAISDQRFKENVRDLDAGLAEVMALKPRLYDWKEGKGPDIKNARGFIAQEFEQVFPDLIDEWKDEAPEGEDPYKSVRQDLIPVLVKAIQEQQAIIQTLEARLAALEAK